MLLVPFDSGVQDCEKVEKVREIKKRKSLNPLLIMRVPALIFAPFAPMGRNIFSQRRKERKEILVSRDFGDVFFLRSHLREEENILYRSGIGHDHG